MGIEKAAKRLHALVSRLIAGMMYIAAGVTFVLMMLTVADVSGRYFFNRPISGTYELTLLAMCAIVFFAVAYMAHRGGDIVVGLVVSKFSQKAQAIIESITSFLSLGLISLITWQTALLARTIMLKGETTALLSVPIYLAISAIALGCFILCLVLLVSFCRFLSESVRK